MKKIIGALLFLAVIGCGERYTRTVANDVPKTTMISVNVIVQQLVMTFDGGEFHVEKSTVPATIYGSGVFISPQGHILTCGHLFDMGHSTITITLNNGDSLKGTLLYEDRAKDLALVKIEGVYPYATLTTRSLKVGREVIAVGNPQVLDFSVTHGIISRINRDINEGYTFTQTDAPINPGNSGGPLFDLNGDLVGINARKEEGDGLGFAISPETIKEFLRMFKGL